MRVDVAEVASELPWHDMRIVHPDAGNVPCGRGRFRRSFAVSDRDYRSEEQLAQAVGYLSVMYTISAQRSRPRATWLYNRAHHTTISLRRARGRLVIRGRTDCLPAGL